MHAVFGPDDTRSTGRGALPLDSGVDSRGDTNNRPEIEELYGEIPGLPVSVFIDRDGHVAMKHVGVSTRTEHEEIIQPLAATQLVEESGAILSPHQLATLEQWFDKGLNVVLNQVLLATTDGQ